MIKMDFKLGGFKNMLGPEIFSYLYNVNFASKVKVMISLWSQIPGFPSWIYLGFDFWFWILPVLWPEAIYLMTVSTISLICKMDNPCLFTIIPVYYYHIFLYIMRVKVFIIYESNVYSNKSYFSSFFPCRELLYCFSDRIVSIYYSKFFSIMSFPLAG